jgi:hypothetical protein
VLAQEKAALFKSENAAPKKSHLASGTTRDGDPQMTRRQSGAVPNETALSGI